MPQEKNILVNRGIPRTLSLPNHGFGSNWDHSTVTINADLGRDGFDVATDWVIEGNLHTETIYKENIKNIVRITEAELVNTRAYVRATAKGGTDALALELNALSLLLSSLTTEHQKQITTANLFYGHDPLTHKGRDPYMKGFDVPFRISEKNYIKAAEKWNVSYAAAYHAKFLAEQMKLLNARIATQNRAIADANARAAAAAQAKAQAEAKRVAAEKARKTAEAEAKRVAEERAQLEESEAAERVAAAEQLRAETARIRAKFAAMRAQMDAFWAERYELLRAPSLNRPFPVRGSAAAFGPVFTLLNGSLATNPATTTALKAALRAAVAATLEAATAAAAPLVAGFAALLYPSELGNGDLYALSVPLSELTPDSPHDLLAIAAVQGEVRLPVVIGSSTKGNKTEFVIAATNEMTIPAGTPVRLATLEPHGHFYKSYSPDALSTEMTWTPVVNPSNVSTSLPMIDPLVTVYNGTNAAAQNGRIDTNPEQSPYSFGGFITVFPVESGIPPIYTVFNGPYEGATTKGEYSGRDFDPEQAGGPILELDWRTATVTQEGIDAVKLHIARLDQSDANDVMIERLENILSGKLAITDVDKRFYTHETRELERFRAQGLADDFIPSDGSAEWNNAHTATLEDYRLGSNESLLYSSKALDAGKKQMEEIYKRLLKGEL